MRNCASGKLKIDNNGIEWSVAWPTLGERMAEKKEKTQYSTQ